MIGIKFLLIRTVGSTVCVNKFHSTLKANQVSVNQLLFIKLDISGTYLYFIITYLLIINI